MKKILSILMLAIALIGLNACAEANASEQKKEEKVYICTGKYAKRYHRYSDCRGLGSCKGDVELVPLSTAKKQGKTPCGYCYGH